MTPQGAPQVVVSDGRTAHAEVMLDAPQAEAFAYVTDLQNMVTWWPEHTSYRRIFGDGGPGSLYVWTYATSLNAGRDSPFNVGNVGRDFPFNMGRSFNVGRDSPFAGLSLGIPLAGGSMVLERAANHRFVYFVRSVGILVRFEYGFMSEGPSQTRMTFAMRSYLLPPPIPPEQLNQAFARLGQILARGHEAG